MKKLILSLSLLAVTSANASVIECKNRGRADVPSSSDLTLSAEVVSSTVLKNVRIKTVQDSLGGIDDKARVGHASQSTAKATANYNPRKFVNSNQFVLQPRSSKKNHFGVAVEECQFVLMVPKTITKASRGDRLTIPMLVHCDQSGGREDLACVVK